MNELKIIDQREVLGKQFRIYGTPENPLFLAKDVASWIEHSKPSAMIESVDDDEKLMETLFTSGQNRQVWLLTEDGMYEVLFQSRKPIAKAFKKEVKKILKTIRQTGGYIPTTPQMSDLEIVSRALLITQRTIDMQKNAITTLQNKNAVQEQVILGLQSKANYAETILQSKSLVNINQIAKDYGMSAKKMNKILNALGIQYKQGGQWLLYSQHQGKGYTHSETVNITHKDGTSDVKMNTKWTQKGREFLYNELKKHGYLQMIEREIV